MASATAQEVGRYVEAFHGPRQEKVWILRLGAKEKREALVQIWGVDHELDGRILKTRIQQGERPRYEIKVDGAPFNLLLRTSLTCLDLWLPGETESIPLCYDRQLSESGHPQRFLENYEKQGR
ncbi:MAG: hypothetical protein LBR88_11075 [Zoogloeaceae bacterium]|nr:hypothetical protein [Zoogloeaceae bacterium]